jgi:hypothetical protein
MNEYKTTDIVLAASLKLKGFNMLRIDVEGSKGTFVFENVDKNVLLDFDLGKILVEPVAFNNTIRQLTTSVRRLLP